MGRRRENKVTFRVDDNEWAIIHGLAEKANLPMEEYIRRCCLSGDKVIIQDGEAIRALIGEVHRIGNNINQAARIANSTKSISGDMVKQIITWEKEIYYALHDVKYQ